MTVLVGTIKSYEENIKSYSDSIGMIGSQITEKIADVDKNRTLLTSYENLIVSKLKSVQSAQISEGQLNSILEEFQRQVNEATTAKVSAEEAVAELNSKMDALVYIQTTAQTSMTSLEGDVKKAREIFSKYSKEKNVFLHSNIEEKQSNFNSKISSDKSLFANIQSIVQTVKTKTADLSEVINAILTNDIPLSVIKSDDGKKLYPELNSILENVKLYRSKLVRIESEVDTELNKANLASQEIEKLTTQIQSMANSDPSAKRDLLIESLNKLKEFTDILNQSSEKIEKGRDEILTYNYELDDFHDKAKQFRKLIDEADKYKLEEEQKKVQGEQAQGQQAQGQQAQAPIQVIIQQSPQVQDTVKKANAAIQNAKATNTVEAKQNAKETIANAKTAIQNQINKNKVLIEANKQVAAKANSISTNARKIPNTTELVNTTEEIENQANENVNQLENENEALENEEANLEEEEENLEGEEEEEEEENNTQEGGRQTRKKKKVSKRKTRKVKGKK
jgi:chromosome segregation ATPase